MVAGCEIRGGTSNIGTSNIEGKRPEAGGGEDGEASLRWWPVRCSAANRVSFLPPVPLTRRGRSDLADGTWRGW
jgi:hypothetical protein